MRPVKLFDRSAAFTLAFSLMVSLAPALHADDGREFNEGFTPIKFEAFKNRLRLRGELFQLDASGQKLLAPTTEIREWAAGPKANKIENNWFMKIKGHKMIAMQHVWHLSEDKSIKYLIRQCEDFIYDKDGMVKGCTKVIREEERTLENFAPVTWIADQTKDARLVLRFTPQITDVRERENLDHIPIGGDRNSFEVTDNQGFLWAERVRLGGVVSGLTTHRGSLVFSFYPFAGAKAMGTANGKVINLQPTDDLHVRIRSDAEIVPGELNVKVYGRYLPKVKTRGPMSASSFGHENDKNLPADFR